MNTTIQIKKQGEIILPTELCTKYNINKGAVLHLIDLDGAFLLTPEKTTITDLVREIEKARLEAGVEVQDLLAGLQEERERIYMEKYGK